MSDAPQSKQRARYLFSDHHEAIIDEKTFIAVAKEKQRRCNIEVDENGVHARKPEYTAKTEFLDLSKKNRLLDRPD